MMVNEKKKRKYAHVWSRVFWHLMCIRISLVHTDACNIISQSIFTGISLQPLNYSIWRGGSFSTMTYGTLMESYSVTVLTTTWACLAQIWCSKFWLPLAIKARSTETCLVLFRGIRGHRSLTLFPLRCFFPLRRHTRHIRCQWSDIIVAVSMVVSTTSNSLADSK